MKLVWSPETASKAYIETVESCELYQDSSVAELVSAMAAGWDARFIVETWSRGGTITTSIGLAVACHHTGGRHVCIVEDEGSRSDYLEELGKAGRSTEVIVGKAEEMMGGLKGIDFMVVDSRREDFATILRLAELSHRGAVLICRNTNTRSGGLSFKWRNVIRGESRLVRASLLPVGKGLDIAYVAYSDGSSSSGKAARSWFQDADSQSGEELNRSCCLLLALFCSCLFCRQILKCKRTL